MERGLNFPSRQSFAWLGLIGASLVVFFFQLGSYRTLGTHEVIAAVPAREMVNTGDWVVPRYAQVPRLQKPPLVYWLVAASSWLCGDVSPFAARLHSAIAAIGLVGLMSYWAARWYGREAAFGAGLIQATSLWALNYGRRAEIDMTLCLLTTGALFLIASQPPEECGARRQFRGIAVWTLLGLSWLAKFQFGIAFVLAPVVVFEFFQRRTRELRCLVNPLGILIALACVVVWPWLLLRQCPEALEIWRKETIGRATGEMQSSPWWYYLPQLFTLTLPWIGNLLAALPLSWRRAWQARDERERFLWTWLLVGLVMLSVAANKHANYLIVLLPATTLLASQSWARTSAKLMRGQIRVPANISTLAAGLVIALSIAAIGGTALRWPQWTGPVVFVSVGLMASVAVSWWRLRRSDWRGAGWAMLAGGLCLFVSANSWLLLELDPRRALADFGQHVRQKILKDRPVCVCAASGVLPGQHPVVYYLDDPVLRVETLAELQQRLKQTGELLVIMESSRTPLVTSFADVEELARTSPAYARSEPELICLRMRDRSSHDSQSDRRMPPLASRSENRITN